MIQPRLACLGLTFFIASAALSQPAAPPQLPRGVDPNDWEAWYDAGVRELERDPNVAEAAFIHASRLRPDRAEPLFARWVSIWTRDVTLFLEYRRGDEKAVRNPSFRERKRCCSGHCSAIPLCIRGR